MQEDFFKWNSVFETGITRIDIQHKVIVKLLNELHDIILEENDKNSIDNVIYELAQYTDYHFGTEEKFFEKYNYPEKKEHTLEHKKFIAKINDIVQNKKNDKDFAAIDLLNFLKDWLLEHIMVTDQKYATFFNENNIHIDEVNS